MHDLVEKFCTPPRLEITNFDLKAVEGSEKSQINFEGIQIPLYSWGEGKNVLLVHGWGSRASHMALFARSLAAAGFRVYAFDAPAHSSVAQNPSKEMSSMFEFGRCIAAVAGYIGNLHAIVAHSLGTISGIFSLAGYKIFNDYSFTADKIVLLSAPASVESTIVSYCRSHSLNDNEMKTLKDELENDFDFKISDYQVRYALKDIPNEILIVHDEDDSDVPVSDSADFKRENPETKFHFTKGLGHSRVLMDRNTIKYVVDYLK